MRSVKGRNTVDESFRSFNFILFIFFFFSETGKECWDFILWNKRGGRDQILLVSVVNAYGICMILGR